MMRLLWEILLLFIYYGRSCQQRLLELPLPKSFLNPSIDVAQLSVGGASKREVKELRHIKKPSYILSTPQHSLFISSFLDDEVLFVPDSRDPNAVAYTFAAGHGMDGPWGIVRDARHVYISSFTSDQIHIYDMDTWGFIKSFGNEEEMNCPEGLAISDADRLLYVASFLSDSIVVYSLDGAYQGAVISRSQHLKGPEDVAFLPNGLLLVSSHYSDSILMYNVSTGLLVSKFAHVERPVGITVAFDGHVYATSYVTNAVMRYNGTTGAFMDIYATSDNLQGPSSISFADPRSMYCASYNNDKVILFNTTTSVSISLPLRYRT